MTTRDVVRSESTIFWKLIIDPTQFSNYYCEPVTRYFESEPEPSILQDYRWKCSFTENMINGTASVDIEIWRSRVPPLLEHQRTQSQAFCQAFDQNIEEQLSQTKGEQISDRNVDISSAKEGEGNVQQTQEESHQQARSQDSSLLMRLGQSTPPQISYRSIAIHTRNKLAPIVSMIFDSPLRDDTPVRVGIDAAVILHKSVYEFEIVLSEETSSKLTPSPSSSHHILDSIFHRVAATSLPDPVTANIWFEFYNYDEGEDEKEGAVVIGAHEQVLTRNTYFAEWIKRERQAQEELRRQQLEDERRIHEQHQQSQYHENLCHNRREGIMADARMPENIPEQQQSYSLQSVSTTTGNLFHQTYPDQYPRKASQQLQLLNEYSSTPHPDHSSLHYLHQPLPALRISVKAFSLETFKVLLQYLYTGRVSLSNQQETEIQAYWNASPENHPTLREEFADSLATHHLDSLYEDNTMECEASGPKNVFPPLWLPRARDTDESVQSNDHSLPSFSRTSQTCYDQHEINSSTIFSPAALLYFWSPCPNKDIGRHYKIHRQYHYHRSDTIYQERKQQQRRPSCTWEDLLEASIVCELAELQALTMRAIQYHCQMLAIQASMDSNTKVSCSGFSNAHLDLQLALSEHILQEFLKLYNVTSSRGNFERYTTSTEDGAEDGAEGGVLTKLSSREITTHYCHSNGSAQSHPWRREPRPGCAIPLNILFNGLECEEALTDLCTNIRIKVLIMREKRT